MVQTSPPAMSVEQFQALFDRCSNWGRWGPDDERGTLNLITPEVTRRAAALIRDGVTVSCALPDHPTGNRKIGAGGATSGVAKRLCAGT